MIFFLKTLFFFSDLVSDPIHDSVRSYPGFVNTTFVLVFTPSLTLSFNPALLVGADCCSPPCSLCLLQSAWASARPWAYRKVEPRRRSRILKWGGVNFLHLNQRNQRNQILFQYLRDKKKKERRGLRKRGVKIHPFYLPWIHAWSLTFPLSMASWYLCRLFARSGCLITSYTKTRNSRCACFSCPPEPRMLLQPLICGNKQSK